MGRAIVIIVLAAALAVALAWHFDLLLTGDDNKIEPGGDTATSKVTPLSELGADLYSGKFPPLEMPKRRTGMDPIVLHGAMNAFEVEEAPAKVQGTVLFIGEQVDEGAVLVAGVAPFISEPYYPTIEIDTGDQKKFVYFYRRLYEGETVKRGQMLGMMYPAKALGGVLKEIAKIGAAEADLDAAIAGEQEGYKRYKRAEYLKSKGVIPEEDFGAALLTWVKLKNEMISAREKVKLAEVDKALADTELRMHDIRAVLPYQSFTIKTIHRPAGAWVKQLDPVVMTVQNLERLMAEASIEEQYYARFKDKKHVSATIEPTVLDAPVHELQGHNGEVNCIAVSKDMQIVSGSEDHTVGVWKPHESAVQRQFDFKEPVKSLACSPPGARENLALAGCGDGNIYVIDLDGNSEPKKIEFPHGKENAITALAFSPDGKYFASGAADGTIQLWTTADASLKYAFVPKNGVAHCHDDAVTSLHFTPQARLVSAGRDKILRVWILKEHGATADAGALRDRDGNVRQLGVSPDGQWMLFDQGRSLRFLSVENHKIIHAINLPPNSQPFDVLATFSPDGTLLLTAGAPEGRLQLWRTPTAESRAFEVRQFAPRDRDRAVSCAAFSPNVTVGDVKPFAVSGSGQKIYLWALPTVQEVKEHRLEHVPLTVKSQILDPTTHTTRIGFEIANPPILPRYPHGRFEAGRPVTIVIEE